MQHIKSGWKSWLMLPLACMAIFILGGISPAQAEQTGGLTPAVELLMGLLGGTVGSSSSYAPIKLQADCSADLGKCWEVRGLNKDNEEQVMDACWKETKKCPKVCKDQYFSRRKAGMKAARADDTVLFGKPSCIPGLDENIKKTPNDSMVRVRVMIDGKPAKAEVFAIPVDDKGHEKKRKRGSPTYSERNAYGNLSDPISLTMPAGRYRLRVVSQDRFYHPYQAFPDQEVLITVQAGKPVDRTYTFATGYLTVKALDSGGRPVNVTVELMQPGRKLPRQRIPMNMRLLSGKYRLFVAETKSHREKTFDIEMKADQTLTQTVTFTAESANGTSSRNASSCFNQVQGKISWSLATRYTRWNPDNINRLCRGEENSSEPPACFDRVMHAGITHGNDGSQWIWQDALDLCEGTSNANETIRCFENDLQKGLTLKQAIQHCGK